MEKEKVEKVSALATSALALALCVLRATGLLSVSLETVGAYPHCPLSSRFLWVFFHTGFIHACLNVWCLLALSFYYHTSMRSFLFAYLVCVAIPDFVIPTTPVVGLSGMIFFLFGSLSLSVKRKLYWQSWMAAALLVGFFFPGSAATVHLYCYVVGLLYAVLTTPIIHHKHHEQ